MHNCIKQVSTSVYFEFETSYVPDINKNLFLNLTHFL